MNQGRNRVKTGWVLYEDYRQEETQPDRSHRFIENE
jgi:hypothetical protein